MNELEVSFEGGPIIVGIASSLRDWKGIESNDYQHLCAVFDDNPTKKVIAVPQRENHCIAIDFGGSGVVRVLRNGESLVLIRAWHDNPDSDEIYGDALVADQLTTSFDGEIEFDTDTLAIAWAAESLVGIPERVPAPMVPEIDLAIDGSVLMHPIARGHYRWNCSEIDLPMGSVVRLVLEIVAAKK